jgi:hypothetical protein
MRGSPQDGLSEAIPIKSTSFYVRDRNHARAAMGFASIYPSYELKNYGLPSAIEAISPLG